MVFCTLTLKLKQSKQDHPPMKHEKIPVQLAEVRNVAISTLSESLTAFGLRIHSTMPFYCVANATRVTRTATARHHIGRQIQKRRKKEAN